MGHQLVRACVFCLLCAAHAHCSSHHDIDNTHAKKISDPNSYSDGGGGHIAASEKSDPKPELDLKNHWMDNQVFVQVVFQKFGNGETITVEGFEKLLRAMSLDGLISSNPHTASINNTERTSEVKDTGNSSSTKIQNSRDYSTVPHCISSESLMRGALVLTPSTYKEVCPVLLSQFLPLQLPNTSCKVGTIHSRSTTHSNKMQDQIKVWLYSTLSIIVISLCGLLGVTVIPIMQKVFYHHFLQFLVALAVGTLCGDALLHLLPHAMMAEGTEDHHGHGHGHGMNMVDHDVNLYRGLVAMLGIIFFYFMEKCLTLIAEMRKRRHRQTQSMPKVRVMREVENNGTNSTGEKLCKHKYSSYPYCYGEIADNPEGHMKGNCDLTDGSPKMSLATKEENGPDTCKPIVKNKYLKEHINGPDVTKENELLAAEKKLIDVSSEGHNTDERYTVIIREHESSHHGHSHTHGHVHSAPQSFSSVAMMVVFGDGLHNFTDGMAIGAAFSANIAGGFSTALAVFCHELPHELGDFAVLLQAGMSAKQAVFYNLLSSILCFVGMCFGVFLGHNETTTQWVFSAAAGMFLYIALVDMIPELTNSHSEGGALLQCVLQLAGLMSGTGIMFLIAIYEHDLKHVFGD